MSARLKILGTLRSSSLANWTCLHLRVLALDDRSVVDVSDRDRNGEFERWRFPLISGYDDLYLGLSGFFLSMQVISLMVRNTSLPYLSYFCLSLSLLKVSKAESHKAYLPSAI